VDNSKLLDIFRDSPLFADSDPDFMLQMLDEYPVVDLATGDTLLDPAVRNEHLYIVLRGHLRIYPGGRALPEHTMLGPGDCAGELSMIDDGRVSALVIAATPTTVLRIPHDYFWAMIENFHGLARNMLKILAGRMRRDNLALVTAAQTLSLEFDFADHVDPLTGVHNRRWIESSLPRVVERHQRSGDPLSLILCDFDNFGEVNRVHGHLNGDAVLRRFGHLLLDRLRPSDMLCRIGGEAFLLILADTAKEVAQMIAERLRATIETTDLGGPDAPLWLTASMGVTHYERGDSLDMLLGRAEAALLDAKAAGRNRVAVA
jgi:diguanylate cyclase (GGDEF)-like protein